MTPMHRAVIGGHYDVCEWLLRKKVNPYVRDKDGQDIIKLAEKDKNNVYLPLALQRAIKKHCAKEYLQI